MAKLTKKQFEEMFREEVLPYVAARYEQDGIPDKPARSEAWNDTIDAYIRDRMLPEAAGNWSHPRWLETYRPRGTNHARKKKTIAQQVRERQDRERTARLDAALATTLEKRRADPYNIASWETPSKRHHATKKTQAQLDQEIVAALAARSGLSKHHRDLLGRRGPGGGLRAGHLTPAGWHGDPMAIEDRRLRLEALRDQPPPRLPRGERSHATRRRGPKEVTYRGYTYNLRSAYDRGYYDALRGVRAQEPSEDYSTGYTAGQHAPYTRR